MHKRRLCGIYGFLNEANGKWYIGQSVSVYARRLHHLSYLRRGRHSNKPLQRAFTKHGEVAFPFFVIETCSIDEINDKECFWIAYHRSHLRTHGYNLELGGNLNKEVTPERRANSSKAQTGKPHPYDHTNNIISPEGRRRISLSKLGKKHSEETKRKISLAKIGRPSPLKGKKGRPLTPEHKAKLLAANLGKSPTQEHRKKISVAKKQAFDRRRNNNQSEMILA